MPKKEVKKMEDTVVVPDTIASEDDVLMSLSDFVELSLSKPITKGYSADRFKDKITGYEPLYLRDKLGDCGLEIVDDKKLTIPIKGKVIDVDKRATSSLLQLLKCSTDLWKNIEIDTSKKIFRDLSSKEIAIACSEVSGEINVRRFFSADKDPYLDRDIYNHVEEVGKEFGIEHIYLYGGGPKADFTVGRYGFASFKVAGRDYYVGFQVLNSEVCKFNLAMELLLIQKSSLGSVFLPVEERTLFASADTRLDPKIMQSIFEPVMKAGVGIAEKYQAKLEFLHTIYVDWEDALHELNGYVNLGKSLFEKLHMLFDSKTEKRRLTKLEFLMTVANVVQKLSFNSRYKIELEASKYLALE